MHNNCFLHLFSLLTKRYPTVHVILLFRSVREFRPYAQGPCRTHTVGPIAYGLADFTLLTHCTYGPLRTSMVHINEPRHDKTNKPVRPAKTQISLGIRSMDSQEHKALIILCGCPAWSESSLGAQVILLVLSCCGLNGNRCKICFSWTAFSRLLLIYTKRQKPCTTKEILIFRIWKYVNSLQVMWNISFRFQASKQETMQSVKRDKRKGEHGVKTKSANAFTGKKN